MTDVELSICVPTLDAYGEMCSGLVASARSTLVGVPCEVVIIDNGGQPQGVTAPINACVRAARGRYVVVANDDVVLQDGWWPPLRDALDRDAIVARPYTTDKQRFGWWLFAMRRELVDELSVEPGEFWDRCMRLWYNDADFQMRINKRYGEGRVVDVMDSRITHRESQSHSLSDPETAARIAADQAEYYSKWSS